MGRYVEGIYMNKKIVLILGILIIFSVSCIGCGSSTSDVTKDERISEKRESVQGTWVLTGAENRVETTSQEDLKELYGGYFVYDFIDKSTVIVGVEPTVEECEYTQEGALVTVIYDESKITLTMIDDDTMMIDNPEVQMILIRQ